MFYRQVIGEGRTAQEALLFARVNQISFNKGILDNTIAKKTRVYEIDISMFETLGYSSSKLISVLHFAGSYMNCSNQESENRREPTKSEKKYYDIMIERLGKDIVSRIFEIYNSKNTEWCLAIQCEDTAFKFLY